MLVKVESDNPERFASGSVIFIERKGRGARDEPALPDEVAEGPDESRLIKTTVLNAIPHKGELLVSFSALPDREAADACKGALLFIPSSEAAPLARGEVWVHELERMEVFDENAGKIGDVQLLMEGAAQQVLSVKTLGGKELLIPFVPEFVLEVDRERMAIVVRLIDGMLPE